MAKKVTASLQQHEPEREKYRKRKVTRRGVSRRNKKLFGEIQHMRATKDIALPPSKSMEEMLDEVRRRAYALWRYAAYEVDQLHPDDFWVQKFDAQGNILVEPHKWIQYEEACRAELEELGLKLIGLGLEERRVRIEEAEAQVVTQFLDMVLDRLNLTEKQQQALPEAIDTALPILEGHAVEKKPLR
jgi:hypothetical protein